eukprot:scaffold659_cov329-Prasinococcus_capsulatus_cf.AAC.46
MSALACMFAAGSSHAEGGVGEQQRSAHRPRIGVQERRAPGAGGGGGARCAGGRQRGAADVAAANAGARPAAHPAAEQRKRLRGQRPQRSRRGDVDAAAAVRAAVAAVARPPHAAARHPGLLRRQPRQAPLGAPRAAAPRGSLLA